MAGWRRVVELAISCEEIKRLTALSRSRTEPASRVSRAMRAYRENPSFCAVGQRVGVHHQTVQRCVERALGYGRWRRSRIGHGRVKNRSSPRRPKPGWCRWRAPRPRSTAIRMSCGRRGFWHVTHASMARRRGTNVSPGWFKARCARSSARRKSGRTRCATHPGTSRCRVRAEDGRGSVRLSRGPDFEESRRQVAQSHQASGDRFLRRKLEMGGLFSRVLVAMAGGFSNPMGRANKRCPLGFAVICGFAAAICGIASDGTIYGTGYSQVKAALESGSQLPASFSL